MGDRINLEDNIGQCYRSANIFLSSMFWCMITFKSRINGLHSKHLMHTFCFRNNIWKNSVYVLKLAKKKKIWTVKNLQFYYYGLSLFRIKQNKKITTFYNVGSWTLAVHSDEGWYIKVWNCAQLPTFLLQRHALRSTHSFVKGWKRPTSG